MPNHISENEFNTGETVVIGGTPYIKADAVVWLDSDDGLHKRQLMDKGELILQYWTGSAWADVAV